MSQQIVYPRILRDDPVREDFFDNHGRVADGIYNLITGSSQGLSICLKGKYGSGKSTVVELLKKKAEGENIKFFCFDVWARALDPAIRRSFLIDLSEFFIREGLANTEVRDNLKVLTGEAEKSRPVANPLTTNQKIVAGFTVLLWLVSLALADKVFDHDLANPSFYNIVIAIILAVFLIFWPLLFFLADKETPSRLTGFMASLLNINLDASQVSQVLVKQVDITHSDLNRYLTTMIDSLPKETQSPAKLVIILENVDRIDNNNSIVPLLSEIFGLLFHVSQSNVYSISCVNLDKKIMKVDPDKMFDIILNIEQGIGYKNRDFFEECLKNAWGDLISDTDPVSAVIWRLFDELTVAITPRRIKKFINELTAEYLSQIDENKDIVMLAAYILTRSQFTHPQELFNPSVHVLRHDLALMIGRDWRKAFAALYFRVREQDALYLTFEEPLKQYLLSQGNFQTARNDIDGLTSNKAFPSVLNKVIENIFAYDLNEKDAFTIINFAAALSFLDLKNFKKRYALRIREALSESFVKAGVDENLLQNINPDVGRAFRFMDMTDFEKLQAMERIAGTMALLILQRAHAWMNFPDRRATAAFAKAWGNALYILHKDGFIGDTFFNVFSSAKYVRREDLLRSDVQDSFMNLAEHVTAEMNTDDAKKVVIEEYLGQIRDFMGWSR